VGYRTYAMTRISLGNIALSAATQTLARDDMDVASRRLTLAHDWANITVAGRSVVRPLGDTHAETVSTAIEFYPSVIAPEAGQLAPALVTIEAADQTTRANTITGEDRRSLLSVKAV
jgi:hypothetical protein